MKPESGIKPPHTTAEEPCCLGSGSWYFKRYTLRELADAVLLRGLTDCKLNCYVFNYTKVMSGSFNLKLLLFKLTGITGVIWRNLMLNCLVSL